MCVFIPLTFLKSVKKLGDKKIFFLDKDDFYILRLPYVTFNDLWGHTIILWKICVFILLVFIEDQYNKNEMIEYEIN